MKTGKGSTGRRTDLAVSIVTDARLASIPSYPGKGGADETGVERDGRINGRTTNGREKEMSKRPMCASCRNGGNEVEADFMVKGIAWRDNERMGPYRANLCDGHLNQMCEDGAVLRIIKRY